MDSHPHAKIDTISGKFVASAVPGDHDFRDVVRIEGDALTIERRQ
jgi:hypothetical protein